MLKTLWSCDSTSCNQYLRPQEAAGEGDLQVTDRCSWVTQLSWLTGLESWPRTFFHGGWRSLICESSFSLLILDARQWYVNMKANTGYAERNLTFLFLSVTSWFWDCSLSLLFFKQLALSVSRRKYFIRKISVLDALWHPLVSNKAHHKLKMEQIPPGNKEMEPVGYFF